MIRNKLIIGSANVNQKYGLKKNIVKTQEFKLILNLAFKKGIDFIDTSPAYGQSEKIIGSSNKNFNIITKIPKIPEYVNLKQINNWVTNKIKNSMRKLKRKKIFGVIVQNAEILMEPKGRIIINLLQRFKNEGIIEKIGISIYNFKTLQKIFNDKIKFDFVQLPYNFFDQSFFKDRLIKELKKKNVEIHARSIFLQGILLKKKPNLPKKLKKLEDLIIRWKAWLNKNKINPVDACLGYVLQNKDIDKLVIGFNSVNNFNDVINFKKPNISMNKFKVKINKDLLDPRNWS